MPYSNPSIADFKGYFNRDFPYGNTFEQVMDDDITKGLADAGTFINQTLFSSQSNYTVAYLLLAAHNLVLNLRASSQGITGQYNFLQNSKGAASVSESFAIPQRILDDPMFSMLTKTNYGAKYLFQILPLLSGQMFVVAGRTLP